MQTEIGMDLGYVLLIFVIFIGVIAVLVKEWERKERRKRDSGKNFSKDQKRTRIKLAENPGLTRHKAENQMYW